MVKTRLLSPTRTRLAAVRFPPNGFAVSLTLFSKCFSPFPHGTCSLSVSCRYLALDGVYHPLWAAIPNNPTRRPPNDVHPLPTDGPTGLSPSLTRRSRSTSGRGSRRGQLASPDHNSPTSRPEIGSLSSSHFARRYWGNPGWFLFLRLLICLSSAGGLARAEVANRFCTPNGKGQLPVGAPTDAGPHNPGSSVAGTRHDRETASSLRGATGGNCNEATPSPPNWKQSKSLPD